MEVQQQINNICDVRDNIKLHNTTILVGENGSGKSVVRKQLSIIMPKKTKNKNAKVKQISMEARVCAGGIEAVFLSEASWEPTSTHTHDMIINLFKSCFDNSEYKGKRLIPYYFVIDELEIGMSRESQLAVCNWLKEKIPEINKKSYGLLIITHSEFVVEQLKDVCDFMDLNNPGRTADEWINREIVPTDFEQLKKDAHQLFQALLPKKG